MEFRKINIVFYDVVSGNSRVKEDAAVIEKDNEEEYQRLVSGFIHKYGYPNVLIEDGEIVILRTRL